MTASFLPPLPMPGPNNSPGWSGGGSGASRFGGSSSSTQVRRMRPTTGAASGSYRVSGSADAMERQAEREAAEARKARQASRVGQTLFDGLEMPDEYGHGEMEYLMSIDRTVPQKDGYGYDVHGTEIVDFTIAAGVEWLRDQAVNNREGYNSVVASLYQAGYLSESDARFGQFTGVVAQAFAEAAYDTARANMGRDPGAVITLFDHLDGIIQGFEESGFGPGGPGGGAAAPPTRLDQFYNPDDLRETLRGAAQNALGRSLTDAEESAFLASFKTKEQTWNDDRFDAEQAGFNGEAADVIDRPNASAGADRFVRSNPKLAQEKAGEDMASYVGVLNRMMGLGGEGIGLATG